MYMKRTHIIGMLAEDQPRVLTKITGLFARQGFTIETMTMGKTTRPGISRIVLTVCGNDTVLERTEKQVRKLLDIMGVSGFKQEESIVKEICLIKVAVRNDKGKNELLKYSETHNVKIVDFTPHSIIFEIVGNPREIDSVLTLMKKFEIQEISRSGVTAMERGSAVHLREDMNGGE
jgi:acetolactate synthase-1/3 small subunit